MSEERETQERETHGGDLAVVAAQAHGIQHLFTLSGAHVFPIYDGAVHRNLPIIDVRHEQTAVFAAEATARLTRTPGLAVVTAGPGVTNGVSAVANAFYNGAPLLMLGGRAPTGRWGEGALQEIDHPPLLAPITKLSDTITATANIGTEIFNALELARSPHRGPAFLDIPMDIFFGPATPEEIAPWSQKVQQVNREDISKISQLLRQSNFPLLILGSDVWAGSAETQALQFAESIQIPVITNGTARGIIPRGNPLLATKARSFAFRSADLVLVVGTPLDFRLGYGDFGSAKVIHVADSPEGIATHAVLAASASGDLSDFFTQLMLEASHEVSADWRDSITQAALKSAAKESEMLEADVSPIHPARIYGELLPKLADDAVIIGDGGDFVSFAGKFVEPARPGCWLDPGPFGCLGGGMGGIIAARLARPSAQVVALFGDGALGFSLGDIDSLVRHNLPAVMIVGNNSAWGLEKHPMQSIFGYDVAADLAPQTRYDDVVRALGGAGEMVTESSQIGPALDRAFESGVPYLVNIITDPAIAYPRTTTGI
ncbi:MAG: acetolactate synthase [Actinobacteria bacterium]|nr:acetolactate synthase [Actinomycetota bacterium]